MRRDLALTSCRRLVRAHSSDEEGEGVGEKWPTMRRPSTHNLRMKAKMRATNKTCWEQSEERSKEGSQDLL